MTTKQNAKTKKSKAFHTVRQQGIPYSTIIHTPSVADLEGVCSLKLLYFSQTSRDLLELCPSLSPYEGPTLYPPEPLRSHDTSTRQHTSMPKPGSASDSGYSSNNIPNSITSVLFYIFQRDLLKVILIGRQWFCNIYLTVCTHFMGLFVCT